LKGEIELYAGIKRNLRICQHPMKRYERLRRVVALLLVFAFSIILFETANAALMSNNWSNLIENRSCMIFTESIDIGGLRVGGRGKIVFTWLDRSLMRTLANDADVDDSISNGLSYYYSNKKEMKQLLKNRDIFLLSYQALKRWDFKIEEIVINGYRLTLDDILTPTYYRVLGEIAPLKLREKVAIEMSTADDEFGVDDYELHVVVPSMPKKGKVKLSYGDDAVEWEIPKR